MRLTVKREDIYKSMSLRTNSTLDRQLSTYDSHRDCPIACALQRTFGVSRDLVAVRPAYISLYNNAEGYKSWEPSHAANEAMRRWDRCAQFDPHTFILTE